MRRAAATMVAVAAVTVGVGAQGSGGPAALAVVAANKAQVIAQFGPGQWSVVGAARACDASAFKLTAREGSLRATAGIALTPLRAVSAAERAAIQTAIVPLFATREREQGVDPKDLARAPLTIDTIHAARSGPDARFYFEASKRLHDVRPPDRTASNDDVDPRGVVRVTVSGWLRGEHAFVPVGTKSELHWDPADEQSPATPSLDLVPLGVAVNGTEPVWVMRRTIGDRVSYLLYAVGPSAVRLLMTVPAHC